MQYINKEYSIIYKNRINKYGENLKNSQKELLAYLLDRLSTVTRKPWYSKTQKIINFLIKKWKCDKKIAREYGDLTSL